VVEVTRRINAGVFWPPGELMCEMKACDEFQPLVTDGFESAEVVGFLQGR